MSDEAEEDPQERARKIALAQKRARRQASRHRKMTRAGLASPIELAMLEREWLLLSQPDHEAQSNRHIMAVWTALHVTTVRVKIPASSSAKQAVGDRLIAGLLRHLNGCDWCAYTHRDAWDWLKIPGT